MKTVKPHKEDINGILIRYTVNKHNDLDGLIIDQQGDLKTVKFPPHTARFIREIAAEGDAVKLALQEKPHPPHHDHKRPKSGPQLESIENTNTHRQFNIAAVKPPHPPDTGRLHTFIIPKPKFTRGGKHDEITGVVFEGNYIHLHPKEYEGDEEMLASAPVLHIKAKKRTDGAGFVNSAGYTVYHAHSLTVGEN